MAPLPLTTEQRNRLVALLASRDALSTPLKRRNLLDEAGLETLHTALDLSGDAETFVGQLLRQSWEAEPALYRALLTWLRNEVRGHAEDAAFVGGLLAEAMRPPAPPRPTAPPTPRPTPSISVSTSPPPGGLSQRKQCEAKADKAAQRWLIVIALLFLLVTLAVAALVVYAFSIFEPLLSAWPILVPAIAFILYAFRKRIPNPSDLEARLLEREIKKRKCHELPDDPSPASGIPVSSVPTATRPPAGTPPSDQRTAELSFLKRRRDLKHFDPANVFTTLSGKTRPVMHHRFTQLPEFNDGPARERPPHSFEDIVVEMQRIGRAVLLGEPGAGKTTTLRKLEVDAIGRALMDAQAPIPLFVPLREWTDGSVPLWEFVQIHAQEIAPWLETLLDSCRLILLLDGLDQVPAEQRSAKALQIKTWLKEHPQSAAVVSCRVLDYGQMALGVDVVEVAPLDPEHIRDYLHRYLAVQPSITPSAAKNQADTLWKALGGSDALLGFWRKISEKGEAQRFWQPTAGVPPYTTWPENRAWRGMAGRMISLASNPYMLLIMVDVFEEEGILPSNRAELFAGFVRRLLGREQLTHTEPLTDEVTLTPQGSALLAALQRVAYAMLRHRAPEQSQGAVVTLPRSEVVPKFLSEEQLRLARSANLLGDDNPISFSHQLLQEYFAAVQMREEIAAGRLKARDLWPRTWERTGWEEATVLVAGLDGQAAVRWCAEANPEVAADCLVRGGSEISDATKRWLHDLWMPRLTDIKREPHPYARAAIGRALALAGLDDRRGVGVRNGIPDIAWVRLAGGTFPIGGDERAFHPLPAQQVNLPALAMAMFPLTNAQWDAFLNAPDGYDDARWWRELAAGKQQRREPSWRDSNHPRDSVNWYEAVAFCRWFSARLGYEVRLPTEIEWERAARGKSGRIMPWGGKQPESGYATSAETYGEKVGPYYLRRTSPVGMYPHGATPEGLHDMSGNVWEWTSTAWAEEGGGTDNLMSGLPRVLRGGSWGGDPQVARACSRCVDLPQGRFWRAGFRVVSSAPAVLETFKR